MKERKPRHNPNKPQNLYGNHCKLYEADGGYYCPARHKSMKEILTICGGNQHNCIKVKMKLLASYNAKS